MKITSRALAGAMLAAAASPALAGGVDLSGQSIQPLFQPGNYAQLTYGTVDPRVSGVYPGTSYRSGDMAPTYSIGGAAVKSDFGNHLSAALILDQPWGSKADYPAGVNYPLQGAIGNLDSTGVTLMGRYKFHGNFSVDAGLRYITVSGNIGLPVVIPPATTPSWYASTYSPASAVGYVVGAAYERPAIDLRASLTYSSATSYSLSGTAGDATAKMPQSVNFNFQTGVAPKTLLMASARWADWSAASINDSLIGPIVTYGHNTISYSFGLGHQFTPNLSAAISLGYEPAVPGTVSDLDPTNGYTSIGVGGAWTHGKIRVSGGVAQYWLGNANTTTGGYFAGNTAVGAGLKVAFSF